MDFVGHLEELRRRIFICLGFSLIVGILIFARGHILMAIVTHPANGIIPEFIFTTPSEAFLAYLKVVLLSTLIICFPVILYELWAFLAPALDLGIRRWISLWFLMALACFFGGVAFGYFMALPAALKFLISFGEGLARPMISLAQYVGFFATIVLLSGVVFEIPTVIGILTVLGIVNARMLRAGRRYAILGIFVLAAVITPTQDVVNMLVFAVPMIGLYEIGILFSAMVGRGREKNVSG